MSPGPELTLFNGAEALVGALRIRPKVGFVEWAGREIRNGDGTRFRFLPYQLVPASGLFDPRITSTSLRWFTGAGKTYLFAIGMGYAVTQLKMECGTMFPAEKQSARWFEKKLMPVLRATAAVRSIRMLKDNTLDKSWENGASIEGSGANSGGGLRTLELDLMNSEEIDAIKQDAGDEGDKLAPVRGPRARKAEAVYLALLLPEREGLQQHRCRAGAGRPMQLALRVPEVRPGVGLPHRPHRLPPPGSRRRPRPSARYAPGPSPTPTARRAAPRPATGSTATGSWSRGATSRMRNTAQPRVPPRLHGLRRPAPRQPAQLPAPGRRQAREDRGGEEQGEGAPRIRQHDGRRVLRGVRRAEGRADRARRPPRGLPPGRDAPRRRAAADVGCRREQGLHLSRDRRRGENGEEWGIAYETIHGSWMEPKTWRQLSKFVFQTFDHPLGIKLRARKGCLDTRYQTSTARKWCKANRGKGAVAVTGSNQLGVPLLNGKRKDPETLVPVWSIGTHEAKDLIYQHVEVERDTESEDGEFPHGYMHWPKVECYRERYFDGLLSEDSAMKKGAGGEFHRFFFHPPGAPRNEPLDCRVYARAARALMKPNFAAIRANLERRAEEGKNPKPKQRGNWRAGRKPYIRPRKNWL